MALSLSILIRSSGITLVLGIGGWIAMSLFRDRHNGVRRLRLFGGLFLIGVTIQATWALWAKPREWHEWPIGGWPRSYMSQLPLKSGNEPELGTATIRDVAQRVEHNAAEDATALDYIVTGKGTWHETWYLPWIFGTVVLVAMGVLDSIRQNGGSVFDWYFLAYEAMYLVWPWDFEIRFFIPIVPFACLYAWRGLQIVAKQDRRVWTMVAAPIALACAILAARSFSQRDLQLDAAVLTWLVTAIAAAILGVTGWNPSTAIVRASLVTILLALVGNGVLRETRVAAANRSFDITAVPNYGDMQASEWLRTHTPHNAVVMARQLDVVFHYSQRKVVWFPPSSDVEILMDGIRKYQVGFIVVTERRGESYWKPEEAASFGKLAAAFPHLFRIAHCQGGAIIYAVEHPSEENQDSFNGEGEDRPST
jgi:hypothetical protein